MKSVTFAVAFILTASFVIAGIILFPNILGQAATSNNDFVFELFLGSFVVLLFFSWIGEKVFLKVCKKKE